MWNVFQQQIIIFKESKGNPSLLSRLLDRRLSVREEKNWFFGNLELKFPKSPTKIGFSADDEATSDLSMKC